MDGETGAHAWRAGAYGFGSGARVRELGLWDRIKVDAILLTEPPGYANAHALRRQLVGVAKEPLLGWSCAMEEAMHDERIDVPWDDATDNERSAVMELWWVKACPEAGSDEYLILQMMSTTDMRHGDPQSAQGTLIERGLLELTSEHRSNFTEKGREVFLSLLDKGARVHDMSTADPTPEGTKRHPPDGFSALTRSNIPSANRALALRIVPSGARAVAVAMRVRHAWRSMRLLARPTVSSSG